MEKCHVPNCAEQITTDFTAYHANATKDGVPDCKQHAFSMCASHASLYWGLTLDLADTMRDRPCRRCGATIHTLEDIATRRPIL